MPARTLAPGRVAVGLTGGMSLPAGALDDRDDAADPARAAVAALAGPGFGAAVSVRAGVVDRLEAMVAVEAARASAGVRWAALQQDKGWDLSLGVRAGGAWAAPDGQSALEVDTFAAGGAGIEARLGRTWTDFLSLWIAAQADAGPWDLDATWNGTPASDHGTMVGLGGVIGLRVGFRTIFTGLELGARWVQIHGQHASRSGLVLVPAFGLSIETR